MIWTLMSHLPSGYFSKLLTLFPYSFFISPLSWTRPTVSGPPYLVSEPAPYSCHSGCALSARLGYRKSTTWICARSRAKWSTAALP